MTKVIMVQGTMSNSGKSFLVAGLCRMLKRRGFKVAPFKSQNMALNSYITEDGMEMGRAQVMQAEAAGIKPSVEMNPILLKPTSNTGSQVILNGKVHANMGASEYYKNKKKFIPYILEAYNKLCESYDVIVIEGAGSPAEINLNENDIVNMGLAKLVDAPVLLVADIDRGGVFASVYGTVALMDDDAKARIKGIVINKFRGDKNLLTPGFDMLAKHFKKINIDIPVLGVIPMKKIDIDDEDSLSERLETNNVTFNTKKINIAIIKLPHISNFTDFNPLSRRKEIVMKYISTPNEMENADLVIIPGTKNTLYDLRWLKNMGFTHDNLAKKNIIGICGGFQMLGNELIDEYGVEEGGAEEGLKLLNFSTIFAKEKTTRQTETEIINTPDFIDLCNSTIKGYEIHMGSTIDPKENPFTKSDITDNGGFVNNNIMGTYIHGIFENDNFVDAIISGLIKKTGKKVTIDTNINDFDIYKESQYDLLADLIEESLDINAILNILDKSEK
nr:cobyric acid synthase [uncultured Lachnoanaerobaculum sp.]